MTTLAVSTADPLLAVGVLHVLRDAVIAFLAIVFALGGVVGFLIGKAVYRRR